MGSESYRMSARIKACECGALQPFPPIEECPTCKRLAELKAVLADEETENATLNAAVAKLERERDEALEALRSIDPNNWNDGCGCCMEELLVDSKEWIRGQAVLERASSQ